MRKTFLIFGILFLKLALFSQDFNPILKGGYNQLSFEEFSELLKKDYGITTFYKNEWVKDISVTIGVDSLSLRKMLTDQLGIYNLQFDLIGTDRLFIYPGIPIITGIPEFQPQAPSETSNIRESQPIFAEQKYLQGRKPDRIETIIIGQKRNGLSSRPVTIQGSIVNKETGEPVAGATLIIPETGRGAVSNQNGIISMAIKPGNYTAQFSYIGLKNIKARLEVYSAGSFSVEMEPEVIALTEVQIIGNEYRKVKGTEMGIERVNVQAIKQLPVLMGEKDIIRISTLLPGVVTSSEASSGLNVRGGNADQNLFIIEDIPLFNTSHALGFFSAFNSDIIKDFSIYKGNIPARYGGRLSSVFDISARKGNLKSYNAHAGISPISAYLTLEGPVKSEKASILLSGRSTYSDWMLKRLEDPVLRKSEASFSDFAGSYFSRLNDNNDLSIFLYYSKDRVNLHKLNSYAYQNEGISMNWSHQYSPAFRSDFTMVHSGYNFVSENYNLPATAYAHNYSIRHNEVKYNFNLLQGLKHDLDFGANIILYSLNRGDIQPLPGSYRKPVDLGRENGLQSGIYLSDRISLADWLILDAGVRFNTFTFFGPAIVNTYYENTERKEENISNVKIYDKYEPVKTYTNPAFRSGLNVKLANNTSLKFSVSQLHQYLFMTSNTLAIAPDDKWKLSDYHLKPQHGLQYSAGLYYYLNKKDINISLEYYQRNIENIVEYKDGADFVDIPYTEVSVLQGDQHSWGLEFMLEKKSGRLDGWISYAYSRSLVTVNGINPWDKINNGKTYPANYDKPNVLNLVGTYRINRIFVLSSAMVYATGRPITLPESLYFIDNKPYISFSDRNSRRVSDYFRADLSLNVEGNLKKKKPFHSTWILSVYNLSGRKNTQTIFFRNEEDIIKGYEFSVIGVPIITVTYSVKLGNYASK